ncbi:hypothetical protein [Rhizobium grahamii]|uniref:SyrB-like regulator n=2 Tax=Rhizobium grahamii TaxID=1120045 RepID=S3IB58_9HYPH|nr:hypothetical protein [Rhizobium grahamii]EPE96483.1 hypothetical protein RGCCGE502_20085 [Rhizobium grahamii CCGE 502]RDJ03281.1 hypothetical protein B5K06_30250 [Rhizobium grahamii]
MADENNTGSPSDGGTTAAPTDVAPQKKQRGPRKKAAIEVTGAATPLAKSPKGTRRKRGEQVGEAKPASVETSVAAKDKSGAAVKGPRKYGSAKQGRQPGTVSASASDEFADLIQLEEENKKLRKSLAEKLRSENADLRKRLGLN